ncbi:VanZ family protein [Vulcaniibacterium gelatinicum]|uniref:VanZ family protein n=1 Tax=Vulcaniibacterium gelatinicum TaxID=2598725 RepID=UPI0011C96397|nr:VanZ family protein [Vulcaniibacterium gelatinicum]
MWGEGALKPLRRPRLWLGLWWAAVFAGIVVSLVPPPPVPAPPGSDKAVHALCYGLLGAGAVQLFATGAALWRAGLGLVALGLALEVAQGLLTETRQFDLRDALANTLGVGLGLLTRATPWCDLLLRWERR